MIEFGGSIYYIDVEAFDRAITSKNTTEIVTGTDKKTFANSSNDIVTTEVTESTRERGKEIEAAKYDLLREMVMIILDNDDEGDDASLGVDRALAKTPLSYKIAFNTLINYGILKEKEEDED